MKDGIWCGFLVSFSTAAFAHQVELLAVVEPQIVAEHGLEAVQQRIAYQVALTNGFHQQAATEVEYRLVEVVVMPDNLWQHWPNAAEVAAMYSQNAMKLALPEDDLPFMPALRIGALNDHSYDAGLALIGEAIIRHGVDVVAYYVNDCTQDGDFTLCGYARFPNAVGVAWNTSNTILAHELGHNAGGLGHPSAAECEASNKVMCMYGIGRPEVMAEPFSAAEIATIKAARNGSGNSRSGEAAGGAEQRWLGHINPAPAAWGRLLLAAGDEATVGRQQQLDYQLQLVDDDGQPLIRTDNISAELYVATAGYYSLWSRQIVLPAGQSELDIQLSLADLPLAAGEQSLLIGIRNGRGALADSQLRLMVAAAEPAAATTTPVATATPLASAVIDSSSSGQTAEVTANAATGGGDQGGGGSWALLPLLLLALLAALRRRSAAVMGALVLTSPLRLQWQHCA